MSWRERFTMALFVTVVMLGVGAVVASAWYPSFTDIWWWMYK